LIKTREASILKELMGAKSPLTSEEIATVINVTSRTVRNDIKELESIISRHGATIKSVRGMGYELLIHNDVKFRELLQEQFQKNLYEGGSLPNTPEGRSIYLIKRLLLTEDYLKIEELAEELYISKSTIQSDFRDVKKILETYDILLESRPNYGIKIKGEELKLRFCMSEFIFNRNESFTYLDSREISILPAEDMTGIKEVIVEQIKCHKISLSDISLDNLVIHIAIALKRIEHGNHVSLPPNDLSDIQKESEYKVAFKIIRQLERQYEVNFPEGEIAYITIHLLGTKTVAQEEKDLQSLVDEEIYSLTMKILEEIELELNPGIIHDRELMIALCLHLKPSINRFKYGMNIRNPMLSEIKINYPVAFEGGIIAGRVLQKELGISINEHEIGYLALHIGAAMERKEMDLLPKRCLVVCASGTGSAKLLQYKLQAKFGPKLEILGTTEAYKLKDLQLHSVDFVISTIPIPGPISIPVIEVKTFLGEDDYERVNTMLREYQTELAEYVTEDRVLLQKRFDSREEVLQYICKELNKQGLVDHEFYQSVIERETISPTSFGNLVAIPHPVTPQTDSTFWAFCTLQKPIDWGGKRVQFICLLSVEKSGNGDLQRMYEMLGHFVDDGAKVQRLLKCKTYKEFIDTFMKE
jgi:lichenan operon transcriptional antiterminator